MKRTDFKKVDATTYQHKTSGLLIWQKITRKEYGYNEFLVCANENSIPCFSGSTFASCLEYLSQPAKKRHYYIEDLVYNEEQNSIVTSDCKYYTQQDAKSYSYWIAVATGSLIGQNANDFMFVSKSLWKRGTEYSMMYNIASLISSLSHKYATA